MHVNSFAAYHSYSIPIALLILTGSVRDFFSSGSLSVYWNICGHNAASGAQEILMPLPCISSMLYCLYILIKSCDKKQLTTLVMQH